LPGPPYEIAHDTLKLVERLTPMLFDGIPLFPRPHQLDTKLAARFDLWKPSHRQPQVIGECDPE